MAISIITPTQAQSAQRRLMYHSTKRPSASVFNTLNSLARHSSKEYHQDDRLLPPGIFSQPANTPMTLIGSCNSKQRRASHHILLLHSHMSYFISSMPSAGLIEIPPESKVSPFTNQYNWTGFRILITFIFNNRH